jgi:hypothetical protein
MSRPSADTRNLLRLTHLPFILLILVNLCIGLLSFEVYGASWDEPGFYRYASTIPYAYSLQERLNGQFQIEKAFGPAQEGNKMYGPAYLLMAGVLVKILTSVFQLPWYPSWHLINFLTFQAGIIFFYLLCLRWMSSKAAFAAALLLSTQPVLWGHAFINPKDIPFMSFFLAAIYFGFWGFDHLAKEKDLHPKYTSRLTRLFLGMLPAGIILGLLASIRMLGPFAGLLIAFYALIKYGKKSITGLLVMTLVAFLVNYLTWPYLWDNPLQRYLEVFQYMSQNPVIVSVLFQGIFYRSNHLPATYFPGMVFINFTEVTWLLFFTGLFTLAWKKAYKMIDWQSLFPVLLWFLLPFLYVVIYTPPLYDGLRHFLFILPPIFIFTGFAFERLFAWLQKTWMQGILVIAIVFSGIFGILRLFPYEYTYYNRFVGGTGGAFRRFETDFWLTCYKEALAEIQKIRPDVTKVYVLRNPDLAAEEAQGNLAVEDYWPVKDQVPKGSLILLTTRFDDDLNVRYYEPLFLNVGREGADFCIVRQVGE